MNSRKKRRDAYKAAQITWEQVWELPLHCDKYSLYAWSKNGTMAITLEHENDYKQDEALLKSIVNRINGGPLLDSAGHWSNNTCDFFLDGKYIFCVRGWGHLTGCGAMNLHPKDAERIQDEFIAFVLNRLNANEKEES